MVNRLNNFPAELQLQILENLSFKDLPAEIEALAKSYAYAEEHTAQEKEIRFKENADELWQEIMCRHLSDAVVNADEDKDKALLRIARCREYFGLFRTSKAELTTGETARLLYKIARGLEDRGFQSPPFAKLLFKRFERKSSVKRSDQLLGAASLGCTKLLSVVLSQIPSKAKTHLMQKALAAAAVYGQLEIAKLLLGSEADVNFANHEGWTPLALSCDNGHFDTVQYLLARNADVRVTTVADIETPLHLACRKGNIDIVRALVEKQADVNVASRAGDTPLSLACQAGHSDIILYLLEQGAAVNVNAGRYGRTPLHLVCANGDLEAVQRLMQKGADVNAQDHKGHTPLQNACRNGHMKIVQGLIAQHADVNTADFYGQTPLFSACLHRKFDIMPYLLDQGAAVNVKDEQHVTTPLHLVCAKGHVEAVQHLIKKGADVHARNISDATPLHQACLKSRLNLKSYIDVAHLLVKNGADVNSKDNNGMTPLHYACENNQLDLVLYLVVRGANIFVKNNHSKSPLDYLNENLSLSKGLIILLSGLCVLFYPVGILLNFFKTWFRAIKLMCEHYISQVQSSMTSGPSNASSSSSGADYLNATLS